MDVRIETSSGVATFALDEQRGFWHCASTFPEGDFPLIQIVNGKRYELYSDGTLAEVKLRPTGA